MPSHKRRASDHDDQYVAKRAHTEITDPRLDQETLIPSTSIETFNDFKIEVKLRSTSKAALNDPRPNSPQHELLQDLLSEWSDAELDTEPHSATVSCPKSDPSTNYDAGETRHQKEIPIDDDDVGKLSAHDPLERAVATAHSMRRPIDARKCQEKETVINEDEVEYVDDGKDASGDSDEDDPDVEDDEHDEDEDRSEFDDDFDFKWLEPIDVEVTSTPTQDEYGEPKKVAYCRAKLVRRGQMRHDFYGEMEQPSRETSLLAFDLFDRYGRLRTEFKSHPIIKGTGVWGQELDCGDMLLIEEVFVSPDYRRKRLGTRMIESLLKVVRQKTRAFFTFVWPTFLRLHDLEIEWDNLQDVAAKDQMADREHDRAVSFCRSLGFRRVASTIWFALASDNDHPSLQLTPKDDFEPTKTTLTTLHTLLSPFQQIGHPPPLTPDQMFDQQPRENPNFLGVLHNCMQQNGSADACWTSRDDHGNTILHLAASILNVECVEWILNQDFGTQLLEMRNNRGETPLELLQFKLEKLRTKRVINYLTVPVSDQFEGYGESAVRCLILLKGLVSVKSLVESQGQDNFLRIVRGCTCGQCLMGFLSPRMSHALLCQAGIARDMMDDDITRWSGPQWVDFNEDYLRYLPSRVLNNLKTNKSMRQGFTNLCLYISTCLEMRKVPDEPNVLEIIRDAGEWPPATRNFLERGGTVASVFLAICRRAMEEDEWTGNGEHQEMCGEVIAKLLECRNDGKFGYVSGMCGYRRISMTSNVDMMGNRLDEDGNTIDSLL